jgi:hypothetical protein
MQSLPQQKMEGRSALYPGTHWLGTWVGFRAGLEAVAVISYCLKEVALSL